MKKQLFFFYTLLIGIILILGCSGIFSQPPQKSAAGQKGFIIAGSGSNLPITGKLVEEYNQLYDAALQMPSSIGSSGGIKAVTSGAIDLALISRPLKDGEKAQGLKELPYARVGIVLGVNTDVPDNNITSQDILDIFKGKKSRWTNGYMIIVLSREEGDSSNQVLSKTIPGYRDMLADSLKQQRWQVYYTDAEEAHAIENTPYSIGLTDTGALIAEHLKIKPLKVNGVAPTIINMQNGSYKLFKDLYFTYREPLSADSQKFLNFVFSPDGSKIIEANGGIALKGM